MSELVNVRKTASNFRWQFLATASVIALIGSAFEAGRAEAADDSDHPSVWIELGGQLSRLDDQQEAFSPLVMDGRPAMFSPSQKFERLPLYTFDETGKISFAPASWDFVLSASVRYGRSGSDKHVRQQTYPKPTYFHYTSRGVQRTRVGLAYEARFADTKTQNDEHHLILDFQAGKDVGLGMFGGKTLSSIFSLGVRFAQFSSTSNIALKSDPDWRRLYKYVNLPSYGINHEKLTSAQPYHSNAANIRATRSFRGVGPSVSWNASAPVAGGTQRGGLTFDWGMNAAVLFGRQRVQVQHQTTARYQSAPKYIPPAYQYGKLLYHHSAAHVRTRSVVVPNVGGFAGASVQYANAKLSLGYRADFFFGAMDGGIDAAKKENVGFYGPFASVSIGFGG